MGLMKKNYGYTLFELLFTLAIVGILLVIALPSFNALMQDSKLVNTINQLNTLTALARSEAIKRNNPVILCRSSDGETCSSSGNIILIKSDNNSNGDFTESNDEMLRVFQLLEPDGYISMHFESFNSYAIVFSAIGAPSSAGRIEICDDRGTSYAKAMVINMGGQLRALDITEKDLITCS